MIYFTNAESFVFCVITVSMFVLGSQDDLLNKKCRYCQFLVATFEAGLRKTARNHFAGGDTAWEERNLGKYATSETRFIETMEDICKKTVLINEHRYAGLENLESKCAHLVEENEEILEEYYYRHQSSNMTVWLCESRLEVCCPNGHYGKDCSKCPGLELSGSPCYGHGSCHGDGSRLGNGTCVCDRGYSGNMCRKCAPDFYDKSKSNDSVECEKCFEACAGGCTSAGPKGCIKCRSGWTQTTDEGCIDIDECEIKTNCNRANEKCVNEAGSFRCECADDYKRQGDDCVLDVEAMPFRFDYLKEFAAKPYRMFIPPDTMLKSISMLSLTAIIAFVVWQRSILLIFLTTIAVALIIFIDMNVNPETIPDEAKKYLGL
ncbi:calcium binding EGF domain protein [Dictyocaulus viviparus]|uniref:Calcium binding EGF domain protein n=1 Tax=Dictyocaulus viviparus TaxID=29172 RepID=A0A0D8Y6G2_DICVI|nr:calcium binding EGF domain protein [Dictyocaulus viviparus]